MKIFTKKRVLAAVGLLVAGAAALAWANRNRFVAGGLPEA
jgi:hypothetical protein